MSRNDWSIPCYIYFPQTRFDVDAKCLNILSSCAPVQLLAVGIMSFLL